MAVAIPKQMLMVYIIFWVLLVLRYSFMRLVGHRAAAGRPSLIYALAMEQWLFMVSSLLAGVRWFDGPRPVTGRPRYSHQSSHLVVERSICSWRHFASLRSGIKKITGLVLDTLEKTVFSSLSVQKEDIKKFVARLATPKVR